MGGFAAYEMGQQLNRGLFGQQPGLQGFMPQQAMIPQQGLIGQTLGGFNQPYGQNYGLSDSFNYISIYEFFNFLSD